MKRAPLVHGGVFQDEAFARRYARKHGTMAEALGREYGRKLAGRGFVRGRILDAGCGSGSTLTVLAHFFPESELVGIDLSDPLLALARESVKGGDLGGRLSFQKADVQRIPFPDRAFDVVMCLNMTHLVDHPLRMLDEIERVSAPGGVVFLSDLRRSWLGLLEREIRSAFSAREAHDLIRRSSLRPGDFRTGLLWWRYESRSPTRVSTSF